MNVKENDWLLESVANPQFGVAEFEDAGINVGNTSFLDEKTYTGLKQIQEMEQFQTDGKFDKDKFHKQYVAAKIGYNNLSNHKYTDDIVKSQMTFHRDDIFAPREKRRTGIDAYFAQDINPEGELKGVVELGKTFENPLSARELAEQEEYLMNPLEATREDGTIDYSKAKWGQAPGEGIFSKGFWDNFFDVKVLAQWDSDGYDINPVTGQKEKHVKGQNKINANGKYYYESLDGRSIVGKEVLSKADTLTKEGSWFNKYDFLDSDDREKSIIGTTFKTVASIAPMFLPGIGTWYTAAGISLEAAKLFSTMGEMVTEPIMGHDNGLFNWVEGMADSFKLGTSDHSRANMWTGENLINMIGDTFQQLAQQRFLFQQLPKFFNGGVNLADKAAQEKVYQDLLAKQTKVSFEDLKAAYNGGRLEVDDLLKGMALTKDSYNVVKANMQLEKMVDSYQNIGKNLSQLYMTGITVQDAYKQAKEEGASDLEAAGLMIGYALGEYGIINSDLGKWVLPELKQKSLNWKRLASVLSESKEALQVGKLTGSKAAKRGYMQKLMNFGRSLAEADYSSIGQTAASVGASALAEGAEEVTEEVWADLAKVAFNAYGWLTGDDTRLKATWDNGGFSNTASDYMLNFLGGAVGGGLMNATDSYRQARMFKQMSFDDAMQHLIYLSRNGELDDFRRAVKKMRLGDENLSTKGEVINTVDKDGKEVPTFQFSQADGEDNQNTANQNKVLALADFIDNTLNAQGASLSDDSVLSILDGEEMLKEYRFMALRQSGTASQYLREWNLACKDVVKAVADVNTAYGAYTDEQKKQRRESGIESAEVETAKLKLKEAQEALEEFKNGNKTVEFLKQGLVEMSSAVRSAYMKSSFIEYAEAKEHTTFDKISDERKSELAEDYKTWLNSTGLDSIKTASQIHYSLLDRFSEYFKQHIQRDFSGMNPDDQQLLLELESLIKQRYTGTYDPNSQQILGSLLRKGNPDFMDNVKSFLAMSEMGTSQAIFEDLYSKYSTPEQQTTREQILTEVVNAKMELSKLLLDSETNEDPEQLALIDEAMLTQIQLIKDAQGKLDNLYVEAGTMALLNLAEGVKEKGWLNEITRGALQKSIRMAQGNIISKLYDEFGDDNPDLTDEERQHLTEVSKRLANAYSDINKLRHSDTLEFLDKMTLAAKGNIKASDILKDIEKTLQENVDNPEAIVFSKQQLDAMDELEHIFQLAAAQVLSARYDAADADNVWGINATLNELDSDNDYVVINKDLANAILQDLSAIRRRVQLAKDIAIANQALKLNEQSNTGAIKDLIVYREIMDKFIPHVDALPGGDELKRTLEGLEDLADNVETIGKPITPETKIKITKATRIMENALYDFFEKLDLNDSEKIASLFSTFNFLDDSNPPLNGDSKTLSGLALFWHIAARGMVKHDQFMHLYKDTISTDHAPVPTLLEATYLAFSMMMKGKKGQLFAKILQLCVQNQIDNATQETLSNANILSADGTLGVDLLKEIKNYVHSSSQYNPLFATMAFIEGLPGTGKSDGVMRSVVSMLQHCEDGKKLLENVWVVHNTKENAQKLGTNIGLDPEHTTYLSIDELYERISDGRKARTASSFDDKGNLIVQSSDYIVDDSYVIHSSSKIKLTKNAPTAIFIDETSNHSYLDCDILTKFQQEYGTPITLAGDLQQSKVSGLVNIDYGEKDGAKKSETKKMLLSRNNFAICPRLGLVFRAANNAMSSTIVGLLEQIGDLEAGKKVDLNLPHYCEITEGELKGLYGVRILHTHQTTPDWSSTSSPNNPSLEYYLDLMISTLEDSGDTEHPNKIGLITPNKTTSKLAQLVLSNPKYSDKIEIYEGNAAQGLEGQYYIFDGTVPVDEKGVIMADKYWSDAYTAISRASLGCLWVHEDGDTPKLNIFNPDSGFDSLKMEDVVITEIPKESIQEFSNKLKALYDEMYNEDVEPITYEEMDSNRSEHEKEKPEEKEVPSEKESEGGEGEGGFDDRKKHLESINRSKPSTKKKNLITKGPDDKEEFNLLLHQLFSKELGGTIDDAGNLILKKNSGRCDSFNGLLAIVKPSAIHTTADTITIDAREWKRVEREVLIPLQHMGLYGDNLSDIESVFRRSLGIKKDAKTYIRFGFKSLARKKANINGIDMYVAKDDNSTTYARFNRDVSERLRANFVNDSKSLIPPTKQFFIEFGEYTADGKSSAPIVEIPLVSMPNPLTILNDPDLAAIQQLDLQLNAKKPFANVYDELSRLEEELRKNPSIPGAIEFANLCKLFIFTLNGVHYFNLDFVLGKNAQSFGCIVGNQSKGANYVTEGFENFDPLTQEGKWISLLEFMDSSYYNVSPIYMTNATYTGPDGNVHKVAKAGMPFILVSDLSSSELTRKYGLTSGANALLDAYMKLLMDPTLDLSVTLVYVDTPKFTMDEYFKGLEVTFSAKKIQSRIGNEFTPYRLIKAIFDNEDLFDFKDYNVTSTEKGHAHKHLNKLEEMEQEILKLDPSSSTYESDKDAIVKRQKHYLRTVQAGDKRTPERIFLDVLLRMYRVLVGEGETLDPEKSKEHQLKFVLKLEDCMKKAINPHTGKSYNYEGIYYNPKYKDETKGLFQLTSVENNYFAEDPDHPFLVNGNVIKPSLQLDMSDILLELVDSITTPSRGLTSMDHMKIYADGKGGFTGIVKSKIDTLLGDPKLRISDSLKSEIKEAFKDGDIESFDPILQWLRENNHLIVLDGSHVWISEKVEGIDVNKLILPEKLTTISSDAEFSVTYEGNPNYRMNIKFDKGFIQEIKLYKLSEVEESGGSVEGAAETLEAYEPATEIGGDWTQLKTCLDTLLETAPLNIDTSVIESVQLLVELMLTPEFYNQFTDDDIDFALDMLDSVVEGDDNISELTKLLKYLKNNKSKSLKMLTRSESDPVKKTVEELSCIIPFIKIKA